MKKLIALSLTLMLSFSLAACGKESGQSTNNAENTGSADGSADQDSSDSESESDSDSDSDSDSNADSDMAYVKDKGTLIVGITEFEPMDYKDENGNWIGFDADMAAAFAESLGVSVEFIEIDWDKIGRAHV